MEKFLHKLADIFTHAGGIITWCTCTIGSLLAGYEGRMFLILFCVIVDAYWGINNAIRAGRFVLSDLMRDTINKILAYMSVFLVLLGIEKVEGIESQICTTIIVGLIAATELWSISGNILIRHPNLLFFRLLKPALIGEIARKLHVDEQQVEDILNGKDTKENGTEIKETVQESDIHDR